MAIIYDDKSLDKYVTSAIDVSPQHPVLIDRFLENAREYDVDALSDRESVVIGGIMEHIEEAGIHSGDSTCVLPPIVIEEEHLETMRQYTRKLGEALGRGRFDEHPVRRGRRPGLRPGGQSPGQSDGALCQQGNGCPFG